MWSGGAAGARGCGGGAAESAGLHPGSLLGVERSGGRDYCGLPRPGLASGKRGGGSRKRLRRAAEGGAARGDEGLGGAGGGC